jgi:hypothetical protein
MSVNAKLTRLLVVAAACATLAACPPNSLLSDVEQKVAQFGGPQITAFSFAGFATDPGVINQSAGTITVTLPYGTTVTALVAAFATSASSVQVGSVSQVSGVTQNNFTNPVVYTTIGPNGATKNYTVTVAIAAAPVGAAWTASPSGMPASANWSAVAYGNGTFVAVASGSTNAAYSADGKNWTASTLGTPVGANWVGVTYGGGIFVAVASGSKDAAYSADGNIWTASTLGTPAAASWLGVTYGNGKFVTVASGTGGLAAYSSDGNVWISASTPPGTLCQTLTGVTYGSSGFVTISDGAATPFATSTDGSHWSLNYTSNFMGSSITFGNNTYVAVGGSGVETSPTGATWTTGSIVSPENVLAFGNGVFVAIANKLASYSTDGINWSSSPYGMPSTANWSAAAYGKGTFVAVASGGTKAASSP